jgi:hypothetical protein
MWDHHDGVFFTCADSVTNAGEAARHPQASVRLTAQYPASPISIDPMKSSARAPLAFLPSPLRASSCAAVTHTDNSPLPRTRFYTAAPGLVRGRGGSPWCVGCCYGGIASAGTGNSGEFLAVVEGPPRDRALPQADPLGRAITGESRLPIFEIISHTCCSVQLEVGVTEAHGRRWRQGLRRWDKAPPCFCTSASGEKEIACAPLDEVMTAQIGLIKYRFGRVYYSRWIGIGRIGSHLGYFKSDP